MYRLSWVLGCILFLNVQVLSQKIFFSSEDSLWARKTMSKLSTREKVAQLFMADVSPQTDNISQKKKMIDLIKKQKIGGIIIMKGDYGLTSEWIREFQKTSAVPLFVSTDGEWGIHMRISNTTKFPYALSLGALSNDSLIYEMGKAIARDCRRLGIHINFGPVLDVNINPKNPVINYRSFGENTYRVSQKGINYALGMQSQGVVACAKHFPGHGDTDVDSHFDLPIINKSKENLEEIELLPFQQAIYNNIWGIMVAHLKVPSIEPSNKPTSLSKATINDLLKNEMGFEGLVFSDALNMKGVSESNIAGQLELDAYIAGNDILLMSENIETAILKIESYVLTSSDIATSRELDAKVFKILLFKHKLNTMILPELVSSPQESYNQSLSEQLHKESITFISNEKTAETPILEKGKSTLFISLSENQTEFKKLMENFNSFSFTRISKNATELEYTRLLDGLPPYEQIIVDYHDLSQQEKNNFGLSPQQIRFIKELNQRSGVINIWFGNPYGLRYFQNARNIIIAYEDNLRTQKSVYELLSKNELIRGKLPVSVGKFKEGLNYLNIKQVSSSVHTDSSKMNNPIEEIDLSTLSKSAILERVETICQSIISNGVAPGGQIYVLYKGKEIYNKSFGYHTYAPDAAPVKTTDIYDLASVSKILGTSLAVMKLKDMGKLDIHDKVGKYLKLDEFNTVSEILLSELLTHEAGLTPFIPFYLRFNDSNFYQYFSPQPISGFTTQVADNLYIRDDYKDTMWYETTHNERKNIGKYKYSDLSMYILQRVVESAAGAPLDEFLNKCFYKPMGVGLCYNPSRKYPKTRIVPTELDTKFRLQQVHGFVHDQGCALYGGVCGHAGLFGHATDVGKVMQMLLQGGTYNKKQYLKPETISLFTSQQNLNSRRGLGFDKPNVDDLNSSPTATECSFATFGHTGFTGTCAWADPFNELVFVFLSNRVFPSADNKKLAKGNYRERLQSLFYQYVK